MFLEDCEILMNLEIAKGIYLMRVKKELGLKNTKAGQFFMLESKGNFLRRPISLHYMDEEKGELEFYYEVKGEGTRNIAKLHDYINIQGPLGNGFDTEISGKNIILVGGGMGIAPMKELLKRVREKNQVTFIAGGRSEEHLNIIKNFDLDGISTILTTDDGSLGLKGRVDERLKEVLEGGKFDKIYTCGPMPMMASVAKIGEVNGIDTEVSLEARMACGVKACVGCSIMTKAGMKKVCHDGPVFEGKIVEF